MQTPPFRLLAISVALGALAPLMAQKLDGGNDGDSVKRAESIALLRQIESDRNRVIEERRLALIAAQKASSDEARLKILQKHGAEQRERRVKLAENESKVRDALKQQREVQRAQAAR